MTAPPDDTYLLGKLKLSELEKVRLKRVHKNFRKAMFDGLIQIEHYWEHMLPTCKTCEGARRVLRDLIVATRPRD